MTTEPTPKPDRKLSPERERELRELLGLSDVCLEHELAQVLECSTRTVQRLALPYVVIGNRRFYDLPRSAERLRQLARLGTPTPDDDADGRLAPAVRHRLRMQRDAERDQLMEHAPAHVPR